MLLHAGISGNWNSGMVQTSSRIVLSMVCISVMRAFSSSSALALDRVGDFLVHVALVVAAAVDAVDTGGCRQQRVTDPGEQSHIEVAGREAHAVEGRVAVLGDRGSRLPPKR